MFYRYVNVSAVLYVVDASKAGLEDADKVAQARRLMRFLLNEDELRMSAFFLILNVRRSGGTGKKHPSKAHDTPEEDPYENVRFKSFAIDCSDVSKSDPKWIDMIND